MYVKWHILLGIIFAGMFFFIWPSIGLIGFSLIFLSSFLIDIDHYIYYICKKKDWNLKNAYEWYMSMDKKMGLLSRKKRNQIYVSFCFLHGVEILLILLILGIVISEYFLFIFLGFSFHLFLDIIYEQFYIDRLDKISIIYDFLKYRKSKKISSK